MTPKPLNMISTESIISSSFPRGYFMFSFLSSESHCQLFSAHSHGSADLRPEATSQEPPHILTTTTACPGFSLPCTNQRLLIFWVAFPFAFARIPCLHSSPLSSLIISPIGVLPYTYLHTITHLPLLLKTLPLTSILSQQLPHFSALLIPKYLKRIIHA